MELFRYDHEELARNIQTGVDRMTVNYLRAHGARIHRDDVDFHGIEHIDLEVHADGHTLTVKQSSPTGREGDPPAPAALAIATFESQFDGQPSAGVPLGLLTQWLAMLPEGEAQSEKAKATVDPQNPFLAEQQAREEQQLVNPFLADRPKRRAEPNPFAPDDSDKKRRAAFDWLSGDE